MHNMTVGSPLLKIDIGCGATKRSGFVGVDINGNPDFRCDITSERLPFDDASADHIYSSHCLEHLPDGAVLHVFQEITRIAADGAIIEFWHPYAFHRDAFLLGHINHISESTYEHLGCKYRDLWKETLGGQWVLQEVRYLVEPAVLEDLKNAKIKLEFAIRYLHDVVKDLGTFIQIDRTDKIVPKVFRRSACLDRVTTFIQLENGPISTAF